MADSGQLSSDITIKETHPQNRGHRLTVTVSDRKSLAAGTQRPHHRMGCRYNSTVPDERGLSAPSAYAPIRAQSLTGPASPGQQRHCSPCFFDRLREQAARHSPPGRGNTGNNVLPCCPLRPACFSRWQTGLQLVSFVTTASRRMICRCSSYTQPRPYNRVTPRCPPIAPR